MRNGHTCCQRGVLASCEPPPRPTVTNSEMCVAHLWQVDCQMSQLVARLLCVQVEMSSTVSLKWALKPWKCPYRTEWSKYASGNKSRSMCFKYLSYHFSDPLNTTWVCFYLILLMPFKIGNITKCGLLQRFSGITINLSNVSALLKK